MAELYVFCEGATEQNFCKQVLQPAVFPGHNGHVRPLQIAHSRRHGVVHRGGVNKYTVVKKDILNTLNQHQRPGVYFTSMLDLYAIPADFPGKSQVIINRNNPRPCVEALEKAFEDDIGDRRFIAHLQLYEYETLLFADVDAFRWAFDECEQQIEQLRDVVGAFPSIEHINDGPQTAPSKRIIKVFPAYEGRKTTAGPDIAEYTGMERLCECCPHFAQWITNIRDLIAQEQR